MRALILLVTSIAAIVLGTKRKRKGNIESAAADADILAHQNSVQRRDRESFASAEHESSYIDDHPPPPYRLKK